MRAYQIRAATEHGLKPMQDEVRRTRAECLGELAQLPDPIGTLAGSFYRRRIERVAPKPLLGEYLPWMLRAIAELPSSARVQAAGRAWLLLYLHVLSVDDILDIGIADDQTLPIVSSVLLRTAVEHYGRVFPSGSPFWSDFNKLYYETAVAGAREVLETRDRVANVDAAVIDQLADKLALVRLCHVSLLSAAGRDAPSAKEAAALRSFGRAVQLFDDVSDWEADLSAGNFTPLLSLAIRRAGFELPPQKLRALPPEEMLLRLVETEAMEECLRASAEGFREAMSPRPRRDVGGFIDALVETTEWLRERAARVRRLALTERQRLAEPASLAAFRRSKRLREAVADLRREIQVVAQSS